MPTRARRPLYDTHSNTNNWADLSDDIGKAGVKHHGGLTGFGRGVVAEMNRLGMMVDISHVSDDVSQFPNLTRALLEAGCTASDVRNFYGENTLRVMGAAEAVAATR